MARKIIDQFAQKAKAKAQEAYANEVRNYIAGASPTAQERYSSINNAAQYVPKLVANYVSSGKMMRPESLSMYDADVVRTARTDMAAYERQLRDTGYFDMVDNAYGQYASYTSLPFLQKTLDAARAEKEKSIQADKDWEARTNDPVQRAAFLQQSHAEAPFYSWIAANKEAGRDFADPNYDPSDEDLLFLSNAINGTNYKSMTDMQQRLGLDADAYSDEWDKMVDLWYEQDWSNPELPAYKGKERSNYQSMTPTWEKRISNMEGEITRRNAMVTLENEASQMPNFAEMSVYHDNVSLGEPNVWNTSEILERTNAGKYADKDYFINNPIPSDLAFAAKENSLAVRSYLDNGLDQLTGYERSIYNAYVNNGQRDKADEYLGTLRPMLLQRRAEGQTVKNELLATNPWTAIPAFAASAVGSLATGVAAPVQLAGEALGIVDGKNHPIYDINRAVETTTGAQVRAIEENDPLKEMKVFGSTPLSALYKGFYGAVTNLGRASLGAPGALALAAGQAASGSLYENADRADMSGLAQASQALLTAMVEVGTEKIGLDAFFNKGMAGATDYVKQLIVSEMGEEALAYLGGEAVDHAVSTVFGHKGQYATGEEMWTELGETLLGTVISSALMGAPGAVQIHGQNRQTGKGIATNSSFDQVLEIASGMGINSKSRAEAKSIKADQTAGKKITLGRMGRLANTMIKELGDEYGRVIDDVFNEAIVDRMVKLGDDKSVAVNNVEAVKKVAAGGNLTAEERTSLAESNAAVQVIEEIAGDADTSDAFVADVKARSVARKAEVYGKQAALKKAIEGDKSKSATVAENEADRLTKDQKGKDTSADATIKTNGKTEEGKIVGFEGTEGETLKVRVKTDSGVKTVAYEDLQSVKGKGVATIAAMTAKSNSAAMTGEQATEMLATYEQVGGNAAVFATEYTRAFDAGYYGNAAPQSNTLAENVVQQAYASGKRHQMLADDARAQASKQGRAKGDGRVTYIGEAQSNAQVTGAGTEDALRLAVRSMSGTQRATVEGIKAISKATGVNVVLFSSTAAGRSAGIQNGSFNNRTNTIYLDINAGISTEAGMKDARENGTLGYAMLRTMAHELTHFIEGNSAEGYAALKEQAKRELARKGKDWSKLVEEKASASARMGEKLTRIGAEAEVIADACEMMLQDASAIERLAKQNPSLKEKIAGFVRNFIRKIQNALRIIGAGSEEAKTLMEMRDGLMQYSEELTRLWGAGLEEAVGNTQSVEKQAIELSDVNTKFSIREGDPPKKTGIAYKVFFEKNGKLYPPMVANPGGADTPVGVWLNADVGVAAPPSKTGRLQVKAGGKGTQGGSGSLAFRPGWHLGDIPKATQFNRLNKATGVKELFPYNFVWAECEYAMDVDYQEEAMSYGYNANGKFQHSLAGLPKLPVDGYYHYRTNPDPNTVPWVITGAMKVNKILSRAEVDAILREKGVEPTKWQGPDGEQMEADGEARKYSLRSYEKHQIDNWSQSKAIEVYRGDPQQIIDFVERSLANKTLRKKLYFGKVSKELAEAIYAATGVKTENMNLALHSDEVLKIFSDHGNSSSEDSRGQRAVVAEDFARIIDVVTSPDSISLSARDRFGKPVIEFVKEANGRRTVVTYTSEKHNDLRVQTMYVGAKKRSLATPMDEQASINTPEASSGTAPDDILHQGYAVVNQKSIADGQAEDASPDGTDIDTSTDSAYQQYSIRTWAESDYVVKREEAIDRLVKTLHVDREKAAKWIDDVNSISAIILDNKARLDYIPTAVEGVSAFKSNPEHGGSIDMSTICAKRRLATGTLDAIQRALGDAVLTKDDFLHIREMMKERKYEVACGLCFVESSRKNLSKYTKQFLDQFNATHPDNQVSMTDFNTVDGLERVRLLNQEAYSEYEKFMNKLAQRKPKLFEKRTEYRHEILQKFKKDTTVGIKNINGGLRLQSFSDFEIVHLIDMMQVITDMASVGLAGQAYTKVPDFAWALGDTGLKINLSLIAKGVDKDGNLIFDDVEGMNHEEAKRLRDAYSENVGTIVVAFTDEQILAAMKSDFVDFIIPFHRSQWQKSDYKALGLPEGTKDYTMHQNEKLGRKRVKENYMPNDYWDFSKTGKQNAQKYLDKCAADGRTPKFAKFLQNNGDGTYSMKDDGSTDGYWKLLIDFKMYDNNGVGSPQNPVQPNFNMAEAKRMLDAYNGIHDSFPVAQDVVDDFVAEYTGSRGGVKVSNGRVTINNVQKSQRLPDDISTREFLADADSSIADTVEQANALEIYKTRIAAYREATRAVDQAKAALAAATDRAESIKAKNRLDILQKQQSRAYDQLIAAEDTKHIRELTGATTEFIQKQLAGKSEADIANMIAEAESEIASLNEQLSGLKGASRDQTDAVKEQIRMLKSRVTRLRNSATRKLLETRKHYQEMFQRDRARREINAEAAKKADHIKAVVKRLDDRIRHETDYHNVKESMKPAVHKLVQTFIDGFGSLVFDRTKADRLKMVYDALADAETDASAFYSDDVAAMIQELALLAEEDEARRKAPSGSLMDNAQHKLAIYSRVADIADNIWHMVQMADEIFVDGKKTRFAAIGDRTGGEMLARDDYRQLYGVAGKLQKNVAEDLLRKGNMIPTYFFESLGNDGLKEMFDGIMHAQTGYAEAILDGQKAMQSAKKRYNYAAWQGQKPFELKTEQGHTISLTVGQAMSLYATSKREASNELMNTKHLAEGGFRLEGEQRQAQKGKGRIFAASNQMHRMTEGDVAKLASLLTEQQRAYADEMVRYLSEDMAELGNKASMEMFGIRKYQEGYYFPFKTASEQRYQKSTISNLSTTDDARLKHSTFTHRLTKGANTGLVIGEFDAVIADHINRMAAYANFVSPIESMNRVLNYKVAEDGGSETTIRALLERKHGASALDYVQTFLKDMNGGVQTDNRATGFLNSLISAFKRGAVAGSISVALQQPTAYLKAFGYISPKYFAHMTGVNNEAAWDEAMKYSGTAVIKDMGRFDVGMGQTAAEWIAKADEGEFDLWTRAKKYWPFGNGHSWTEAKTRWDGLLSALPGWMDRVTWTHIWKAVKAEQADLHPSMDTNSEAFLRMCGERFDDVINHTQVYDSVLAKSSLMRSTNPLHRMATSFMAEPTLTANILYSAAFGKHSARERVSMVSTAIGANILAAAFGAAISAWNDDEDERTAAEKYLDKFTLLAIDNVLPHNWIPYVSDVFSLIEGYDVERVDMSVIKDIIQYSTKFFGAIEDGRAPTWKECESYIGTLLNLLGVPAKNISRDVRRIKNAATTRWEGITASTAKYTALENLPFGLYADTQKAYYDRYVSAVRNGNKQEAYDLKDYLLSSKKVKEDTFKNGAKDAMKKLVLSGDLSDADAKRILLDNKLVADQKTAFQTVDRWHEGSENYSAYNTVREAFMANNEKEIQTAINELKANGYTPDEISDYIKNQKVIREAVEQGKITPEKATYYLRKYAPYKNDKDNVNKPMEWADNQ